MNEEQAVVAKTSPKVDFSYQFNVIREKVEKKIFSLMCDISKKLLKEKKSIGILVVLGTFGVTTEGMRLFGKQSIEKYINVIYPSSEADISKLFESGDDGAIIINRGGEVLGSGIYLMVDDPTLDIPEGTGTRHISAASFSQREDVLASFTLSEETLSVRLWKNGSLNEHFNPEELEDGDE